MKKIILLCLGFALASEKLEASWLTNYVKNSTVITAFIVATYHTLLLPAYFPSKNTFIQTEPEKQTLTPKKLTYGKKSLLSTMNNKMVYAQKSNIYLMTPAQKIALGQKAAAGITETAKTIPSNITPKQGA